MLTSPHLAVPSIPTPVSTGAVHGAARRWLRAEGLLVLVLATYLYAREGGSWLAFAALFLAPDLSFAGYLGGPRTGAAVYNLAHSYVGPLVLGGVLVGAGGAPMLALIWGAHIGFDRALGYGLKYPSAFGDTHLGRIGRDGPAAPPVRESPRRPV